MLTITGQSAIISNVLASQNIDANYGSLVLTGQIGTIIPGAVFLNASYGILVLTGNIATIVNSGFVPSPERIIIVPDSLKETAASKIPTVLPIRQRRNSVAVVKEKKDRKVVVK
jgi:hypothetical protein